LSISKPKNLGCPSITPFGGMSGLEVLGHEHGVMPNQNPFADLTLKL